MTSTEKKNQKEVNLPQIFKKVIRPRQDEISIKLKCEEPKVRYLKLQPFYRQSRIKSYGNRIVPELRLCGNWLEKAGFSPENYVSVTVMDGLLVIRSTTTVEKED